MRCKSTHYSLENNCLCKKYRKIVINKGMKPAYKT